MYNFFTILSSLKQSPKIVDITKRVETEYFINVGETYMSSNTLLPIYLINNAEYALLCDNGELAEMFGEQRFHDPLKIAFIEEFLSRNRAVLDGSQIKLKIYDENGEDELETFVKCLKFIEKLLI